MAHTHAAFGAIWDSLDTSNAGGPSFAQDVPQPIGPERVVLDIPGERRARHAGLRRRIGQVRRMMRLAGGGLGVAVLSADMKFTAKLHAPWIGLHHDITLAEDVAFWWWLRRVSTRGAPPTLSLQTCSGSVGSGCCVKLARKRRWSDRTWQLGTVNVTSCSRLLARLEETTAGVVLFQGHKWAAPRLPEQRTRFRKTRRDVAFSPALQAATCPCAQL